MGGEESDLSKQNQSIPPARMDASIISRSLSDLSATVSRCGCRLTHLHVEASGIRSHHVILTRLADIVVTRELILQAHKDQERHHRGEEHTTTGRHHRSYVHPLPVSPAWLQPTMTAPPPPPQLAPRTSGSPDCNTDNAMNSKARRRMRIEEATQSSRATNGRFHWRRPE